MPYVQHKKYFALGCNSIIKMLSFEEIYKIKGNNNKKKNLLSSVGLYTISLYIYTQNI